MKLFIRSVNSVADPENQGGMTNHCHSENRSRKRWPLKTVLQFSYLLPPLYRISGPLLKFPLFIQFSRTACDLFFIYACLAWLVHTGPNPCNSNPCQNNGRCMVANWFGNSYQCLCSGGYTGRNCEMRKNPFFFLHNRVYLSFGLSHQVLWICEMVSKGLFNYCPHT